MKTLVKTLVGLGALLLFLLLVVSFSLKLAFEPERTEVLRVASPSGDAVAILYETNGGATTSFGYKVEIAGRDLIPTQQEVASIYGAIRNNRGAYGVMPRWVSDDELHIEYYSSRDDRVIPEVGRKTGKPIQVRLKLNINDLSAPPGGMARP